eukprot:m.107906 g.107906  ORF g.107906 m.107906 type:complete len:328 (-) comp10638_c0_seq4:96-1079(-)
MRPEFVSRYAQSKELLHWFPGHMAKGLKVMGRQLQRCDAVIEVHDARVPVTGRNYKFDLLAGKPRVLVYNKADLAGRDVARRVGEVAVYPERPERHRTAESSTERGYSGDRLVPLFTNCRAQSSAAVRQVVSQVVDLVDEEALQRDPPFLRLMVVGIPNVGKSSMINALRRMFLGKAGCATTGAKPGVTRAVQTDIKIHQSPPVYVIDTPGVMLPLIETEEVGLKLALIGTLRDEVVGHELIADFLLFTLNRHEEFEYVRRFGLDAPSDDIHVVLAGIARRIGALLPGGHLNLELAAQHFVSKYRSGDLGRFTLDDLPPPMKRVRSS